MLATSTGRGLGQSPLPRLLGRDCTLTNASISPRPHVKRLRITVYIIRAAHGSRSLLFDNHVSSDDQGLATTRKNLPVVVPSRT